MIDLKKIETSAKKIYEDSFEVSLVQEDLEKKLDEIYKNNLEMQRGRLSRAAFKANDATLKKDSLTLIKAIKELIKSNLVLCDGMRKEISGQEGKKAKRRSKKCQ